MPDVDPLVLAERLIGAITSGNPEAVREVYAPDCVIWHNHDGLEQSVDENVKLLHWVVKNVCDIRYEEVRRQRTDNGFLQQHVLRGTAPSGKRIELPACLVCTVKGGRITRLEEYLDSAQIAPILGD